MLSILFWLFIIGGIIGAAVKVLQFFDDRKTLREIQSWTKKRD